MIPATKRLNFTSLVLPQQFQVESRTILLLKTYGFLLRNSKEINIKRYHLSETERSKTQPLHSGTWL
jgi:hypothetical protein